MCLRNQKNNVIFRNRKATLMGYFDTLCLLFDKKEDPIDYEIIDDYADSSKYATVKCKSCGKLYKVNRNPGYRTSFFKWSLI